MEVAFGFFCAVIIVSLIVIPRFISAYKQDTTEFHNRSAENSLKANKFRLTTQKESRSKYVEELESKNEELKTSINSYERRIEKLIDRLDEAGLL